MRSEKVQEASRKKGQGKRTSETNWDTTSRQSRDTTPMTAGHLLS